MNKIAVITPYYKEPTSILLQCIQSVFTQTIAADHFMVADGFPNQEIARESIKHLVLPQSHADNGNTPRGIGSLLAASEGYDFIAFLDADNWYHSQHLSSLLELHEITGAKICASYRTFHTIEGAELNIEEFDEINLQHVDTSCLFLAKDAFDVLDVWLNIPKNLSTICDRVFFKNLIHKGYSFASTKRKTVAFRSQYADHYRAAGLPPPDGAKENVAGDAFVWLSSEYGKRQVINRLGFYPI
jgi:glycosyltransferase involved in cell wall biosynthesis